MSYAIIGLIFVLLIVFGVLSAKNWHWVNIVFLILTFVAGSAATAAMAKSLKLRRDNIKNAMDQEKRAVDNEAKMNLAIYGSPNSISYDPGSLRGMNELLTRELYGRGRVWSSGTVTFKGDDPDDGNRIFTFPEPRDAANPQNQMKGIQVYAFADEPVNGVPYPVSFVGTFRVIGETPANIELEPIFITNDANYSNPAGTWSLFEKMPADRRDVFKKIAFGDKTDFLGDNFDLTRYREALVTEHLPASELGMDPNSAEYEQLIDRYAFDGLKLGEIANWIDAQPNRQNPRFEPAPEEVFVEYRFDKKVDGEFEVDAPGSLLTASAFQNGKAVDPALQAGKKIGFAKDDTVLVDQLTAEGFQRINGDLVPPFSEQYPFVTEVDRYYFRQFRDYPYMLADLKRQVERFNEELVRVKTNNGVSQQALDDANAQSTKRADIIIKLDQDRQNLANDLATVTQMMNDLTTQLAEIEQRSRQLDQQIKLQYDAVQKAAGAEKP